MSTLTSTCFLLSLIGFISGQFLPQAPFEIARKGRTKILGCKVDSSVTLSSTAIHFYRLKSEGFQRILHFPAGASKPTIEADFSKKFSGSKRDSEFKVTISNTNDDDAATYYCALWRGDDKVFSSGTRLYVAGDPKPVAPKLSVYGMSKVQTNNKRALLCQATGMFPDMVKFTWQAEDQSKQKVELNDVEMLEQREDKEVKITSMLIVDKQKSIDYTFTCVVKHGETEKMMIITKDEGSVPVPTETCPTSRPKVHEPKEPVKKVEVENKEEKEEETPIDGFELRRSLNLFSVTYVILLVKNILYFCTVCFFLYKRRTANKETLRSTAG